MRVRKQTEKVIVLVVCLVVLVFSPVFSLGATTLIPIFWDDFESYNTGDQIDLKIPPIGQHWIVTGGSYHSFIVVSDPNIVVDGNNALRTERTDPQATVTGMSKPSLPMHEGITAVFEHDVYLPDDTICGFSVDTGASKYPAGWYIGSGGPANWFYRTNVGGVSGWYNSDVPMTRNKWYHMKLELFDDLTWTMTATPEGGNETVLCETVAWADGAGWGDSLGRNWLYPSTNVGEVEYWDNVQTNWYDHLSQGYPPINEVPAGIVIDGDIGATEWDGVKEVAMKDPCSRGNFKTFPYGGTINLASDTVASVHMAYDPNYFYVSLSLTNVVPDPNKDSTFATVFSWDTPGGENDDVIYYFSINAHHSTAVNPDDFYVVRLPRDVGVLPQPDESYDPNDFWDSGGQVGYSVVGDVLEVEMKIPFAIMPEFTGPVSGEKVHVQFNAKDDTGNGTTNLIMQNIPWLSWFGDQGFDPAVGIAFPICGDEDHPYPNGDLSEDCRVNIADLAILASHWLECTDPECD